MGVALLPVRTSLLLDARLSSSTSTTSAATGTAPPFYTERKDMPAMVSVEVLSKPSTASLVACDTSISRLSPWTPPSPSPASSSASISGLSSASATPFADVHQMFDGMPCHQEAPVTCILQVTVCYVIFPVTVEVLHQVFGPFGATNVSVREAAACVEAMVVFRLRQDAVLAQEACNGRCIWDDCCVMDISLVQPVLAVPVAHDDSTTTSTAVADVVPRTSEALISVSSAACHSKSNIHHVETAFQLVEATSKDIPVAPMQVSSPRIANDIKDDSLVLAKSTTDGKLTFCCTQDAFLAVQVYTEAWLVILQQLVTAKSDHALSQEHQSDHRVFDRGKHVLDLKSSSSLVPTVLFHNAAVVGTSTRVYGFMINGGITGGLKVLFQCFPYAAASRLHMQISTYWERLTKQILVMYCTKVPLDLQLVCSTSCCVFDCGKNRKEGIKMTVILRWPWSGNCRTCSLMLPLPRGRPKILLCQLPENYVVWMCTGEPAPELTSLNQLNFTNVEIQKIILLGGSRGIFCQLVFVGTKTKLPPVEELTQICSLFITRMLQIVQQFSHGKFFAIGKCIVVKRKALGNLKNFTNIVDCFGGINILSICSSHDHAISEVNVLIQIIRWDVNCSSMLLSFQAPPTGRHQSNNLMEVPTISEPWDPGDSILQFARWVLTKLEGFSSRSYADLITMILEMKVAGSIWKSRRTDPTLLGCSMRQITPQEVGLTVWNFQEGTRWFSCATKLLMNHGTKASCLLLSIKKLHVTWDPGGFKSGLGQAAI